MFVHLCQFIWNTRKSSFKTYILHGDLILNSLTELRDDLGPLIKNFQLFHSWYQVFCGRNFIAWTVRFKVKRLKKREDDNSNDFGPCSKNNKALISHHANSAASTLSTCEILITHTNLQRGLQSVNLFFFFIFHLFFKDPAWKNGGTVNTQCRVKLLSIGDSHRQSHPHLQHI